MVFTWYAGKYLLNLLVFQLSFNELKNIYKV